MSFEECCPHTVVLDLRAELAETRAQLERLQHDLGHQTFVLQSCIPADRKVLDAADAWLDAMDRLDGRDAAVRALMVAVRQAQSVRRGEKP